MERGIGILIIGFLWGYVLVEPLRRSMGPQWASGGTSAVWPLILQVSSAIVSLSVLIALNGMVSADRKAGYYRFLFSKPVNPVHYYAQLFFVHMIGVLAAMLVLSGLLHTVLPEFNILNYLLYATVIYIAMGGIGFFLSVATRYDWLTLAAVWLGSRILRQIYGPRHDWRSKLVEVLPPVHRLDDVANSLIGRGTANVTDVLWLIGYGALFFALGLLVLRKASLAD
jgi:ABC-type polysaccharide/polyol phosphate export permease